MKTKIFKSLFLIAPIIATSFVLDLAPAAACHPLNPFCRRPQGIIIPSPIVGPQMSPENANESWLRKREGVSNGALKLKLCMFRAGLNLKTRISLQEHLI
jgi:hypothetical protein